MSKAKRYLALIESFKKARVLIIGDFILDQFMWGKVDRISPEAPVPVVNVERDSFMPGGALNVANNIHTLGGKVYPCGVIGRDTPGRLLRKAIRREGIDTGGIVFDKSRPTSVKTRVIAHSQQVVRFDREKTHEVSSDDRRRIIQFVRSRINQTDVVVIEDYGKGVIHPALLKEIVKLAKDSHKPVLVDPKEKHFSYYEGVTAITPNRKEAYYAFNGGMDSSRTLEEVGWGLLRKIKCRSVLMTLGEDGMALFEKGEKITRIPTMAREVFDVSGAGDTVMAVLSLALAVGAKMKDASILANVAAGIVVGKLGTAIVTPAELRQAVLQKDLDPKGKRTA